MIPPNITNLSSDGEDDIIVPIVMVDPLPRGPPLSVVTVDQEPPRPRRRPSAFSGVFRSLNTIEESPTVLDGPIVQEPRECIPNEQNSPPASPRTQSLLFFGTNQREQPPRSPPRRSTAFKRQSTSPENTPPPSPYFPRRTVSRMLSMSTHVLGGTHMPEDRDVEALQNIWWTYAQEASAFDQRKISSLNKSLDSRLVFSGIFSAVLTPFIVESYKLLEKTDSFHGSPKLFGRDGYRVRVNAMWFGSLIFSLLSALFSIHCKQWLDGYGVDLVFAGPATGSSEGLINACRLRQYRYQGMQRYRVPQMIGLLPILIYAALIFFTFGLVDFLWQLDQGVAIFISILCLPALAFYIITTIIPCFTTRSPFKTPLSILLANLWRGMRQRCHPKGLMEHEEQLDVDDLRDELDADSFKWLMNHTKREEVYHLALRAERENLRQQSLRASSATVASS